MTILGYTLTVEELETYKNRIEELERQLKSLKLEFLEEIGIKGIEAMREEANLVNGLDNQKEVC